jgi:type II secretory pathway pseudopilin PulG
VKTGVRGLDSSKSKTQNLQLLSYSPCFLWGKRRAAKKTSEQGLTLLETLVGILVITIVLAASTPPILIAAATRIQNRNAEQAFQIAQQEVDRVRLLMEQGDYADANLPPADSSITDPNNIKNVSAPTTSCNKPCTPTTPTQAIQDGDFLIQTFRETGVREQQVGADPDGNNQVIAFRMGVRVYSNAAIQNLANGGSLEKEAASLQMTDGLGQQRQKPLAVLYTDFVRGDLTLSLQGYRNFLN